MTLLRLSTIALLTAAAAFVAPAATFAADPPAAAAVRDARASAPVRVLSPAEAQADIALMRRALETIHPGLYRRASRARIDAAFTDLEIAARRPISDVALYGRISLMLAEIRCNHTKAEQPRALEAWRTEHASHAPFRFRVIEGRMIVVSVDPGQPGLVRGDEILAINGRPARRILRQLGAYVPIDGATVWSRATGLANDSDLMGADFDHFYPYEFGFPDGYRLAVKSSAGETRSIVMRPINFRTWRTLPWDGAGYGANFADGVTWRMLDGETGYLRVLTFVNYRKPVDAAALYAKALAAMRDAGARRLILDLRDNGGGSNDASLALADALLDRPFVWNRAIRLKTLRYGDLPNFIETWGDRARLFAPTIETFDPAPDGGFDVQAPESPDELLPRSPTAERFAGPVTILTSPANASGSTMLIAKLRDEGRVRLVGERAGGSADGPTAGHIFNVRLPNSGIAIRVPRAFNAMQVQRFDADGGVTPDVSAPQTVADFRAGRDTALLAALADRGAPQAPAPEPDTAPVLRALMGAWRGTLEYRDFQSDERVTLPTDLAAKLAPDGRSISLAFTYDDGPGKVIRDGYALTLDLTEDIAVKTRAKGVDLYRIRHSDAGERAAPLTWTLWGRGMENGVPVDVRETLTLSAAEFTLVRETRPRGGAFAFRNAYRFTRGGR